MSLNKEEYIIYINNAINNTIITGGKSKNRFINSLYKSDYFENYNIENFLSKEDLKNSLDVINKEKNIFLGYTGVNGYSGPLGEFDLSINSSEFFDNDIYIDIMYILNYYFPNQYKIATIHSSKIDENNYKILNDTKIKLILEIGTFNKEKRIELLGNNTLYNLTNYIKNSSKELIEEIVLFYLGDLELFKKDIDKLYKLQINNKRINLKFPLYSSVYNNTNIFNNLEDKWYEALEIFNNSSLKYKYNDVIYLKDSKNEQEIIKEKMKIFFEYLDGELIEYDNIGYLLSERDYDWFVEEYKELKNNILKVKNYTFGGNYKSNKYLTKNDILSTILKNKKHLKYLIFSSAFRFNNKDIFGNYGLQDYPIDLILI